MANNYAVVRTDLMAGTDVKSHLRTAKYFVGTTATEIENGMVLALDSLLEPDVNREVWKAVTPTANQNLEDLILVATPEVMVDPRYQDLTDFINPAGGLIRGYKLHSGDIFSVTAGALSAVPTVGQGVAVQAGTKWKVETFAAATSVGKVIQIETVGALTYYVIQIV